MTTTLNANGRTRKSLAEQIDRLDGILDGLADGLNDAVVSAVKQAVTVAVEQAVKAVLTEVLTNPDIVRTIAATAGTPPPTSYADGGSINLKERATRFSSWVGSRLVACRRACGAACRQAAGAVASAWRRVQALRPFKYHLLAAVAVGVVAGVAAFLAGPWLAAAASGVGGFMTALVVQAGLWVRRAMHFPTLIDA